MARKNGNPYHGWINLDKPIDLSSTQALGAVKRLINPKKAGHAGTLDPLATGVLPLALGDATKLVNYAQDALKTYDFTIKWGERTDTDDREGEIIATSDHIPSAEDITAALPHFSGEIEQIPPKYSAIKIDGQRAYDLARAGHDVEIKSRIVYIKSLNMTSHAGLISNFTCLCGKGTYIRALARDIAQHLGTEGHIIELRRTQVGPFTTENAVSLDVLENLSHKDDLEDILQPLETVLDDIPALYLTEAEASRLKNGNALSFINRVDFDRLTSANINTEDGDTAAAFYNGKLIAMVNITGPRIQPERVFKL